MLITTTLSALREADMCEEEWDTLTEAIGGALEYGEDTPLDVRVVLDRNGLDVALQVLARACGPEGRRVCHLFSCDAAERALAVYEKFEPDDNRPRHAVEVTRMWLSGMADSEHLTAASSDAERAAQCPAHSWNGGCVSAGTTAIDYSWAAADATAARAAAMDAASAAADAAVECSYWGGVGALVHKPTSNPSVVHNSYMVAAEDGSQGAAKLAARAVATDAMLDAILTTSLREAIFRPRAGVSFYGAFDEDFERAWNDERAWQLGRLNDLMGPE